MSKFQRIFKNLREQKNMTQEELAKALGVSKSTIGMYERGDREPNFEKLEVIADYFNVNMSDLIDSKNTASEMLPASKIGVRSHTVAERLNEVMTIRGLKQADVLNLAKPYCDKLNIKSNSVRTISVNMSLGKWNLDKEKLPYWGWHYRYPNYGLWDTMYQWRKHTIIPALFQIVERMR